MARKKANHSDTGAKETYEVGWGKPPVANRFKKGQSGNPKGGSKRQVQQTYSSADLAVRSLTKVIAGKKGDDIVKIEAIDAIFQKRTELALKGDKWAIKECCEDARRYGLLKDPRMVKLSHFLTQEEIDRASDAQLDFLIDVLEKRQAVTPGTMNTRQNNDALFNLARSNGSGYSVERSLTAEQVLARIGALKNSGTSFVIQDENYNKLSEEDLRYLMAR